MFRPLIILIAGLSLLSELEPLEPGSSTFLGTPSEIVLSVPESPEAGWQSIPTEAGFPPLVARGAGRDLTSFTAPLECAWVRPSAPQPEAHSPVVDRPRLPFAAHFRPLLI